MIVILDRLYTLQSYDFNKCLYKCQVFKHENIGSLLNFLVASYHYRITWKKVYLVLRSHTYVIII